MDKGQQPFWLLKPEKFISRPQVCSSKIASYPSILQRQGCNDMLQLCTHKKNKLHMKLWTYKIRITWKIRRSSKKTIRRNTPRNHPTMLALQVFICQCICNRAVNIKSKTRQEKGKGLTVMGMIVIQKYRLDPVRRENSQWIMNLLSWKNCLFKSSDRQQDENCHSYIVICALNNQQNASLEG